MNAHSTISPASAIRAANVATARMFSPRSAGEKPMSAQSPVRTVSPTST
jgi:hypothetical protein